MRKIRVILCLAYLSGCTISYAQQDEQKVAYKLFDFYHPEYSRIHFGILLQYNQPWYHIVKSDAFLRSDTFMSINPVNGTGLSLGILLEWNINKYVQIRSNIAQLVLDYRTVEYQLKYPGFRETPLEIKQIEAPYLQWPLIVKLQSDKISDFFRVYMIAGGMVNINVGDENLQKVSSLLIQNNDWGILAGVGFHLYFSTVTLTPQLQFSAGMTNLIKKDTKSKFNAGIESIYNRTLSFSIIITP